MTISNNSPALKPLNPTRIVRAAYGFYHAVFQGKHIGVFFGYDRASEAIKKATQEAREVNK